MLLLPLVLAAATSGFLPPPAGPHPVGTTVLHLSDPAREEAWTADPGDRRALTVQVWYPARGGRGVARYVPEYEDIRADLALFWPETVEALGETVTAAHLDAPVLRGTAFPLVVLSHGMNSARYFHSALAQELASRGFVVAAIDHTYWGPAAAGPPRVRFADGMAALDTLSSAEIDARMQHGIGVFAADQSFVARRLLAPDLARRFAIARDRVAVAGHSMGGLAAHLSALEDPVFRAGLSFDGFAWVREGNGAIGQPPAPCRKPLLLLVAAQFLPADLAVFRRRYAAAWPSAEVLLLERGRHDSFGDTGLIRGPRAEAIDPIRAHRAVSAVVVDFLERHLKGRPGRPAEVPELRPLPESTPGR
jgi:dienelactone hydrolase